MKSLFSLSVILILVLGITSCSTKLSEEEYYTNATKAYAENKHVEAVENFKELIENYEDTNYYAEALFLLGYINANDLKNYDEAKKYYSAFIAKFPNHELTDDAQYELDNMGKDINELFKKFGADSAVKE